MGDARFDDGRSTLAGSWSGDRAAARRTSTSSTCVRFDGATGGFGGSTIEGAALGTKRGEEASSVSYVALSDPFDDSCGDSCAGTVRSGPLGAANPSIAHNPSHPALSSSK